MGININLSKMKYTSLIVVAALFATQEVAGHKLVASFAPPAPGPYASDTDHLSSECYGADEDDIMYDVFERYRVEERNPVGAGTGIWKIPKSMPTLPPISTTSGENMTTMELVKSTNQR